ncbi:hypothetical protein RZS08_03625, partial [Arthrospira platensis SPKY1]|nr:hypothetical protein [Arthrospira platensis SPKY1]
HDFYYNAYHNWSAPGIPNPILINRSATQYTSEIIFKHGYRHSTGILIPKGGVIVPLQLCVTKVNQQVTNLDNGEKASNVCN